MNWIDWLILGALVLALLNGFRRGAVMQVFSWGGFIAGLFIGGLVAVAIARVMEEGSPGVRLGVAFGAFLVIAFGTEALVAFGGSRLANRIVGPGVRRVNQVLGSVVAAISVLIASWLITVPAQRAPELAADVKGSAFIRAIDAVMPAPPDFLSVLGGVLDRTGFPEVFAELNPSLAPGVEPAPASLARDREVLAAARLTFKIESVGCGGRVDGSGFPVRRDTVITAAHVVAGTREHQVIAAQDAGGATYAARVVYMDSDTDIAVLRVPDLPRRFLEISPEIARRGTDGAAIGYPGGGDRRISVARVRTETQARGRDIYNRRSVRREIYVLRATVRQGNSGGPLVDTDGDVRGMVFAASATNREESYALAQPELHRALRSARGRTSQVKTGRCAI